MSKAKRKPLIEPRAVDGVVNALFSAYTRDLGRPFVAGSRNVREIVQSWCPLKSMDTVCRVDPLDFASSYLPAHFFDRYMYVDELDTSHLLEDSLEKFRDNILRGWLFNNELRAVTDPWLNSVLEEARLICQRVLGELDYTKVFERCGHGPNATTSIKRNESYLDSKMLDFVGTADVMDTFFEHYLEWDSTLARELVRTIALYYPLPSKGSDCVELLQDLIKGSAESVARGDRLSFVPKKHNKLRTISVQPGLNVWFQLGTGRLIADLLKEFANIDIESQDVCHKHLARLASLHPEIGDATLDWSEASDRIWLTLVERLVPPDWYEWLSLIRCEYSIYEEEEFPLPMIGTMGNGFTFPLQTLVFYALLRGVARTEGVREIGITVFGDDCIIPAELELSIKARLAPGLGWSVNKSKSFFSGGFRESCGMDAYRGVDCRPFQVQRPEDLFSKNALKSWSYICYNLVADRLRKAGRTPDEVWRWLVDLHSNLEFGAVLAVPMHFSEGSGVQTPDPKDLPPECLPIVTDKHGGGVFRSLQNAPGTRDAWPNAWYHHALASRPLPTPFRKEAWAQDVSSALSWSRERQREQCSLKEVALKSRETRVLSWTL
jgi:hypothetical protein